MELKLYKIVYEYQDSYDWFVYCIRYVVATSSNEAWKFLTDYLMNDDVKITMTSIEVVEFTNGLILENSEDILNDFDD